MPLVTWELWLARSIVEDNPLPWQKPQLLFTPGRVCQGLQSLLAVIGTPTSVCKTRGKSPGWPSGRVRTHREHYDLTYSQEWRVRRAHQQPLLPGQKPKQGRPKKPKPVEAA